MVTSPTIYKYLDLAISASICLKMFDKTQEFAVNIAWMPKSMVAS